MDYNTPWEICEHNWSDTSIYDKEGKRIVALSIYDEATEETQEKLEKWMANIAELLVEAPNMIEALNVIQNWLVCYAITTPEDMMQAIPNMLEMINKITNKFD